MRMAEAIVFVVFLALAIFISFVSFTTNNSEMFLLVPFLFGIFLYVHGLLEDGDDELL